MIPYYIGRSGYATADVAGSGGNGLSMEVNPANLETILPLTLGVGLGHEFLVSLFSDNDINVLNQSPLFNYEILGK